MNTRKNLKFLERRIKLFLDDESTKLAHLTLSICKKEENEAEQKSGAVETNLQSLHALTLHHFFASPRPLPVDIIHDPSKNSLFVERGQQKHANNIIQALDHVHPDPQPCIFSSQHSCHPWPLSSTYLLPRLHSLFSRGRQSRGSWRAARFSSVKRGVRGSRSGNHRGWSTPGAKMTPKAC